MQQECVDLQGFVMLLAQILDQTPTPAINKDGNEEQLYNHVEISPYQYFVKGVPQQMNECPQTLLLLILTFRPHLRIQQVTGEGRQGRMHVHSQQL